MVLQPPSGSVQLAAGETDQRLTIVPNLRLSFVEAINPE